MTNQKYTVSNTIKDETHKAKCNISEDALKEFEFRTAKILKLAILKARSNGRNTVMARDIWGA